MVTELISLVAPVFGIVLVLGLVVLVGRVLFGSNRNSSITFPYDKQASLFTPAERSFLGVLEQAVGDKHRVFGKVRIADVIKVKTGLNNSVRQSALNRITSKHLDFVVCNSNDLAVQFAVELDDRSHRKPKAKARDAFVDDALKVAEVPLFRFPAKRMYSPQEVKDRLFSPAVSGGSPLAAGGSGSESKVGI